MSTPVCEFCRKCPGPVELEFLNLSEQEVAMANVCEDCAIICLGSQVSYDSDGIMYSNLGCIGGAPEEQN